MNPAPLSACTAIIMAGGSATRMGQDKRFLMVGDESLLNRLIRLLEQHFLEVIISANDPEKLSRLNTRIIRDEHMGKGPLEGLTSALKASQTDYNFVIAVDIPTVDIELVQRMQQHLGHVSAVIPVCVDGHQEPLFAFYSKNCIPIFRSALDEGVLAVHKALKRCPVFHFPMQGEARLKNLNHEKDYRDFIEALE